MLMGGTKMGRCTSTTLLVEKGPREAVTRTTVEQVKHFWLTLVEHPTELARYRRSCKKLYARLEPMAANQR